MANEDNPPATTAQATPISINMAGENPIDNPRASGHRESPFFKLPPEVRNKIYREYFAGSEVSLVIDPPTNVQVVPITGRRSIFSTTNSNHHILLTCYQVYLEALALYWSTTLVRNGCDGHFSRGYFLSRIPALAKPFIQHLRDVSGLPGRGSRLLRGEMIRVSSSLADSFDEFPNLKSCSVKEWRRGPSENRLVEGQSDEAVARHPHVHILDKTLYYQTIPLNPTEIWGPIKRNDWGYPIMIRKVCSLKSTSTPSCPACDVVYGGCN